MPSRLGDPAPQARSGAARYASPAPAKAQIVEESAPTPAMISTPKRQDVKTSKMQKTPMTIRLSPAAIEKLADLERSLRRSGLKAQQASASEIVGALLLAATPETIRRSLVE